MRLHLPWGCTCVRRVDKRASLNFSLPWQIVYIFTLNTSKQLNLFLFFWFCTQGKGNLTEFLFICVHFLTRSCSVFMYMQCCATSDNSELPKTIMQFACLYERFWARDMFSCWQQFYKELPRRWLSSHLVTPLQVSATYLSISVTQVFQYICQSWTESVCRSLG